MAVTSKFNLLNVLRSISSLLDLSSPDLARHQIKVAYIATEVAHVMGLSTQDTNDLLIASLLHDVGALSTEEKLSLVRSEETNTEPHCDNGMRLLRQTQITLRASRIVKDHHTPWREAKESEYTDDTLISQIILAADTLDRFIDRYDYILYQSEEIIEQLKAMSGDELHPGAVKAIEKLGAVEGFWLDLASPRLGHEIPFNSELGKMTLDIAQLKEFSKLICRLIDFRSRFTATHSSGVAASSSALARLFAFSDHDVDLMEIAGLLHDVGKMVVPNSVLEKPGRLDVKEFSLMKQHTYYTYHFIKNVGNLGRVAEWAAFHHERIDGRGYPFHVDSDALSLGSRIMAVADVFTALSEDRPYRRSMSKEEVLKVLFEMAEDNHLEATVFDVLRDNYDDIANITREAQEMARLNYIGAFNIDPLTNMHVIHGQASG